MIDMSSSGSKIEWRHYVNDNSYNVILYENGSDRGIKIGSAGTFENREYKIMIGRLK
jgi:hypothetical protein